MNQESVRRQTVTVNLKNGLHLRPLSQIAEVVRRIGCDVQISKGDFTVSAASVFDLITLKCEYGERLVLQASGERADEALEELVRLFKSDFDDVDLSTA